MMNFLTADEARKIIIKLKEKGYVACYHNLMTWIKEPDGAMKAEFQSEYSKFYRMDKRVYDDSFREKYFSLMETMKDTELDFYKVFFSVYPIRNNTCEISFSSKLLHTLNPVYPIWDSVLTKHFSISAPYFKAKNREHRCCDRYEEYREKFVKYMLSEEGKMLISLFDEIIPDSKISDVKKIDFILWQHRPWKS